MGTWLLIGAVWLGQDAEPLRPYRIEPRLEARDKAEGVQVFAITGSTDLPDDSIVRIDLFRAQTIEGMQYQSKRVRARKGSFEIEFRVFAGAIPPGKYFARVWFDLHEQSESIQEQARREERPREIQVFARIQVGTYEIFVKARKAHAIAVAEKMEEIASEVGRAYGAPEPDRRTAAQGGVDAVRKIKASREADAALDFHFGLRETADHCLHDLYRTSMQALEALAEGRMENAGELVRSCRDKAGEARLRLGLESPVPSTAAELVKELTSTLQVLVDERTEVADGKRSAKAFEGRLALLGSRVSELKLLLANKVESEQYPAVEDACADIDRLLDAVAKPGDAGHEIRAAWTRVSEKLGAMIQR